MLKPVFCHSRGLLLVLWEQKRNQPRREGQEGRKVEMDRNVQCSSAEVGSAC